MHVAAKSAIGESLRHCGAQVVTAASTRARRFIEAARRDDRTDSHLRHNGVARSYGVQLAKLSHDHGLYVEMYMGGVLNEDSPESDTPVDASRELNALGISTPGSINALLEALY